MTYQDFDLLIDRTRRGLRAQVLNSPGGQATAEFNLPFSEDKLENFLLRLGRTRRLTRRVESPEMNTAKTFGAALFNAVFTGDVKACFRSSIEEAKRQGAGLRVRLRLADAEMADLPWEFLYNPAVNRFIALSVQTPLVRYLDLPERIQPISVTPPIRVLVMISSPTDYPALDVEAEWKRLNESIGDLLASGHIAIDRLDDASLSALQRRLRKSQYHIFHFIGHGEFDHEAQEGVLILEGENERGHRVSSQYLGMLLHDHESLRVAILNACEGARSSKSDPFAGSAQSLVQQGIPAVIAMQFEIADDVASTFAHEFYGALADGYPIDAAVTEARKAIFAAGREVEWGTPVLYLRAPDGRIFDVERDGKPKTLSDSVRTPVAPIEQDQMGLAVVNHAKAAFAQGQRREALDILRRFGPPLEIVAHALHELTAEDERLTELERRAAREQEQKEREAAEAEAARQRQLLRHHIAEASSLFTKGDLAAAWARICDALQIESGNPEAVDLESQIRQALDEEAAQNEARERERAQHEEQERARALERDAAIARSRRTIEECLLAGDVARAQDALAQADASLEPGEELADLRAEIIAARARQAKEQHDKAADEIVERARAEFARDPAAAIAMLEQFSPPHRRAASACRELKQLAAEQAERDRVAAEKRAAEVRDRQRAEEQRRRDLEHAVERIDGYLSRNELAEAAAALASAESAFGSIDALQDLSARLDEAQSRATHERHARATIGHARALAAGGDFTAAVAALEAFRPAHRDVDAALASTRADAEASERRRDRDRRVAQALARAQRERSHAAAVASLQEALALDPEHVELIDVLKQRRSALRAELRRARISAFLHSSTLHRIAAAMVVLVLVGGTSFQLYYRSSENPTIADSPFRLPSPQPRPTGTVTEPVTLAKPPDTGASGNAASGNTASVGPAPGSTTSGRTTPGRASNVPPAGRGRETGPAGSGSGGRAPAPPVETRPSTPVDVPAAPPSGAGSSGAGRSGADPSAGGGAKPENPATGGDTTAKPEAPKPSTEKPSTSTGPTPAVVLPRFPTVESALRAYTEAMSGSGNEGLLRAVYPSAPREVIEGLGKTGAGVKSYFMTIPDPRIKPDGEKAVVDCTIFHNYVSNTGRPSTIHEQRRLTLERRADSWSIVDSRRR